MAEKTIRLYEDPSTVSPCAGCSAHIRWYDTLSGRRMPMEVNAAPLRSERIDGRVVVHFSASDSHWANCPARQRFKR